MLNVFFMLTVHKEHFEEMLKLKYSIE